MPYTTVKSLPKAVRSLPTRAKKIFRSAFNKASKEYKEERAFQIAWAAVKKMFTKKGDKWVAKTTVDMKSTLARTGLFGQKYYFDAVLTTSQTASDGFRASSNMLEKLTESNRIDRYGDVDHAKLNLDFRTSKLFSLSNHRYEDGKIVGRFFINKDHPEYDWFINEHKDKPIQLSAEFLNPVYEGDEVVDCEQLGWTVALYDEAVDSLAVEI